MQKTIAIIANGSINDYVWHKQIIDNCDVIICADGGANHAIKLDVIPDFVIGDLDSITVTTKKILTDNNHTKIIHDPNQDKTDLQLAIELATTLDPKELIILGAIGDAMDHTLANIFTLDEINQNIPAKIIDEKNELTLVKNEITITGEKNSIISVIPLTDTEGLTYENLKWEADNIKTSFGWFGVRNRMLTTTAKISLKAGKILVIKQN